MMDPKITLWIIRGEFILEKLIRIITTGEIDARVLDHSSIRTGYVSNVKAVPCLHYD